MNYRIDIIDTQDDRTVLSREKALASSVLLEWKGGDTKDIPIFGSTLRFTFAGLTNADGQYYNLFTGDENRYRVEIISEEEETLWSGFILPDAYSEPYSNAPVLVDFVATDGLGRLKGKFPEFEGEPSVIQVIAGCLAMTGLDIDFRFAPAIENYHQKDWNLIYPDPEGYKDKDAYTILETLLTDLGCSIFQQGNIWNIIGWNYRNLQYYYVNVYSISGDYLYGDLVERLRKDVTGIATPHITMQPPYGVIEVSHDRVDVSLPEGLSSTSDEDWVNYSSSIDSGEVYADEWIMQQDFPPLSKEGTVYFGKSDADAVIAIKRRPYIEQGGRYKIVLSFNVVREDEDIEGVWRDPFDYYIKIGDRVIYTNDSDSEGTNIALFFDDEEPEYETVFEFVATRSGLLDIVLTPVKDNMDNIQHIEITEMTLENVTFEEEDVARVTQEGYTEVKEVALTYAGDATAASIGFRLDKLEELNQYVSFTVPVKRQFTFNGENIAIVDLKGANLIENNIDNVIPSPLEDFEVKRVEYNYNGSQEHAVITDNMLIDIVSGEASFTVRVYDYNTASGDRINWERWTDSIYGIEQDNYTDAYVGLLQRLFNAPLPKIDMDVLDNIQLNDIIQFPYMGQKDFILTACRWNIDKGRSTITGIESYYGAYNQLPPLVVIQGDDSFSSNTRTITAEAFSPNGVITDWQWEVIEGNGSLSGATTDTVVLNTTDNTVTVRVTVTDDNGSTASDEITLYRHINTHLSIDGSGGVFYVNFSPNIPEGYAVNVKGSITIGTNGFRPDDYLKISISGAVLIEEDYNSLARETYYSKEFSLNYTASDTIEVVMIADQRGGPGSQDYIVMSFDISDAEFVVGSGTITGVPAKRVVDVIDDPDRP